MNESFVEVSEAGRRHGLTGRAGKIWPTALCGLGLWLAAGFASAAPSCSIAATAIAFGNYDPLSAVALPGIGTLTFDCTSGVGAGVTFTISLSAGSGSYALRTLKNGANVLSYNLYTTVAHTTVWGDGTGVTRTVTIGPYTKSQLPQPRTVYGLITALQNATPGPYTDSITATVTF